MFNNQAKKTQQVYYLHEQGPKLRGCTAALHSFEVWIESQQ